MRILVVGVGYVGLVTATCFAEVGHEVMALDIDRSKIQSLKQGVIPIFEPGLEEIVERNIQAKRLFFTTDYHEATSFASLAFLALPTPALPSGETDMSYMLEAASSIAKEMKGAMIIVNKSTVPAGTTELIETHMQKILSDRGLTHSVEVVSNPEFLKEGDAVNDFMKPDRIIIGVKSEKAAATLKELYAPFNLNHERMIIMDVASAELTKYAANAMLASRISFMNELSLLCEKTGADISLVRKGIGSDSRIGYDFLYAGCGFGGSCFPKDLKSLRAMGRQHRIATPLLDAIEEVNDRQKELLGDRIAAYFADQGGLENKRIAIWGLAFKPGTDDIRDASALILIRSLLAHGAHCRLFDPVAIDRTKKWFPPSPQLTYHASEYEAAASSHAIALLTEWKQFRFVDFSKILPTLSSRAFFDGRNQYSPKEMAAHGFDYFCIGKPSPIGARC